MGDGDAGPSSACNNVAVNHDAVLSEVLVNQTTLSKVASGAQGPEDEDLVLAKILQEQERALLALTGDRFDPAENVPPRTATSSRSGDGEDAGPVSDEELAWRLMQEEADAFQQRMLALAGFAPQTISQQDGAVGDEYEGRDGDGDDEQDPDSYSYEQLIALGEVVGTVCMGLTDKHIRALPVVRCTDAVAGLRKQNHKDATVNEADKEEQCAVCRIEYELTDDVTVLPCGHYYHPECVATWLQRKKVCPQCNKEVEMS